MKPALLLLELVRLSALLFSQDIQVREEAVRRLERAPAVRSAPNLPNLERTDTLRGFGAELPLAESFLPETSRGRRPISWCGE